MSAAGDAADAPGVEARTAAVPAQKRAPEAAGAALDAGMMVGGWAGAGEDGRWRWRTVGSAAEAAAHGLTVPSEVAEEMAWPMVLVWREGDGVWQPWVAVMESAALRKQGIREAGLYAWGAMKKGQEIGTYAGGVAARWDGKEPAGARLDKWRELRRAGNTMIVEVMLEGACSEWIDGSKMGPPFLQNANDARGVKSGTGGAFGNTARCVNGDMEAMKGMGGAASWTVAMGWAQVARSEILWSYGNEYWKEWGSEAMTRGLQRQAQENRAVAERRLREAAEARLRESVRQAGMRQGQQRARQVRARRRGVQDDEGAQTNDGVRGGEQGGEAGEGTGSGGGASGPQPDGQLRQVRRRVGTEPGGTPGSPVIEREAGAVAQRGGWPPSPAQAGSGKRRAEQGGGAHRWGPRRRRARRLRRRRRGRRRRRLWWKTGTLLRKGEAVRRGRRARRRLRGRWGGRHRCGIGGGCWG